MVSAVALLATAGMAHAIGINPTTLLPDAVSYEYFGLNYAENIVTSSTVGVLNYSGGPGCAGICTASTTLGADPTVGLQVAETTFQGGGGGYARSELTYYVQYDNSVAGNYAVNLMASDVLPAIATGSAPSAQAYLAFGPAYPITTPPSTPQFESYLVNETDCSNRCSEGVGNYTSPSPFPADSVVEMTANKPYLLQMFVEIQPGTTGAQLDASIDPRFSTSATGGQFIFSPGVTSTVPEPAMAWMIAMGLGGLALVAMRGGRGAKGASLSVASRR